MISSPFTVSAPSAAIAAQMLPAVWWSRASGRSRTRHRSARNDAFATRAEMQIPVFLSGQSFAAAPLGRVLIDFDPEADAGKGDCGEQVSCELVIAGRDASEVFELVEEAFHEVALAVEVMGCGALLPAIPLGRDVGARAMVGNAFEDAAGVTAAVGDDVDFAAQPASRASDGVVRTPFFPPAACWWARTTEESRR